jgi:hypothetical protein
MPTTLAARETAGWKSGSSPIERFEHPACRDQLSEEHENGRNWYDPDERGDAEPRSAFGDAKTGLDRAMASSARARCDAALARA